MPLQTNLNVPPYNDTYSPSQGYYRDLFKPGVSVQARELNEIQSMFADQIERFGDNIFRSGTVVSGCNFLFLSPYPYVKLQDQDAFGGPVTPSAYVNTAVLNATTGLRATVIDYADGFVATDPNLKTLYLNYVNTGFDGNQTSFSAGDQLTVYDPIRNGIERVLVTSGGTGFSNAATMFAVPAVAVTPLTGTISNGQFIGNGLGANLQVVGIDSVTLANTGQLILSLAPRAVDLANGQVNSSAWTLANNQTVINSGNTATAVVSGVIGTGYQGLVVTDSLGSIQQVLTLNKGVGYTSLPYMALQSANNSAGFGTLDLEPQNFIARVVAATTANSVGSGYAFGVNQGVVYLNGVFLDVASQRLLVSKYSTAPDAVAVSFTAVETIVTADVDTSLNDPAAGPNNGAPGADRLKITPTLQLTDSAEASTNSGFFPLVVWNQGNPYIQNQQTQYSTVGAAIAQTVSDQSGDFYIDPFLVTSSTSQDANATVAAQTVYLTVDAGTAYISGYKVQTHSSFVLEAPIQTGSVTAPYSLSLNYGNYLTVTELGGVFQFNTGDSVQLYSLPKGFASNSALVRAGNTTPQGTLMGTAQMRSLQYVSGTPGTASARYNLYLFNVQMNSGQSFADVASVYYNGTLKGVADVVPTQSPAGDVAALQFPNTSQLVYQTQFNSIKNVNSASYQFSTVDSTVTAANSGVLTKSLATAGQSFPWPGAVLTAQQMQQLYLVPTAVDLVSSTNAGGTWATNTAIANVVAATGGTALTDLVPGDWVYFLGNTSQVDTRQVTQVVNNTLFVVDSAPAFSNSGAIVTRAYPKGLPVPLGTRAGVSANVSANGTVLSINLGFPIAQVTAEAMSLAFPVVVSNSTPVTKTANRSAFVKICTSNNVGGVSGPWSLGVPDAFRLRSVYVGNSSVDATGTDYSSMFSIDDNQNPDYLGLSWLAIDGNVGSPLGSNSYILVEFDYFTTTGSGYYATPSYVHTTNTEAILALDSTPLSGLGSAASTWEVPEFFSDSGSEWDLLACVDFRPYAQATATPGSNSTNAPLNPSNATSFSATEKSFPTPGSTFNATLESYVGRIDAVFVDSSGSITDSRGKDIVGSSASLIQTPPGSMKVADVGFPPYPNLPANRSVSLTRVINTGVVDTKFATTRLLNHSVALLSSISQDATKVYNQAAIADIDNRLKNVEYYVSLNTLESSVQSLIIPSAADPTVNRYQFGFFADDFTTSTLSQTNNPDYAATRENGDMVPSKLEWEVYLGDEVAGAQPYVQQAILGQLNATIGFAGDPTATPQCAVSMANSVAYQIVYRNAFDDGDVFPQDGSVDVVNVTLADAAHMANAAQASTTGTDQASTVNLGSAQVTLWFYAYDNPVEFQILQGNTVVADSTSAQALSATDVTNLTTGNALAQWFNDRTGIFLQNPVNVSGAFVEYAGKVTWNYSGAGGQAMTIRTTNGTGMTNGWRWVLSYPINGETAGCVPPPPPITCPDGYAYSTATGGCVLGPGETQAPITIDWAGCTNGLLEIAQQLGQLLAAGGGMDIVTVVDVGSAGTGGIEAMGSSVTGTVNDFANPYSSQVQWLLGGSDSAYTSASGIFTAILNDRYQNYWYEENLGAQLGSLMDYSDSSCFLPWSIVTMGDGSTKRMADVSVGDLVQGRWGVNRVLALSRPVIGLRQLISYNGGEHFNTPEHPTWTIDGWRMPEPERYELEDRQQWHLGIDAYGRRFPLWHEGLESVAGPLSVGDEVGHLDGFRRVESMDYYDLPPSTQLYSLVCDGDHTMYVDGWCVAAWATDRDFDYASRRGT